MRPLDRLPTIRAKLGSTIVFAVGMTVVLVYLFLGFALKSASRDADLVELTRVANRAAGSDLRAVPDGVTIALLRDGLGEARQLVPGAEARGQAVGRDRAASDMAHLR